MHVRMLKGLKGGLYERASPAMGWALDQLRETLRDVGFVVNKRSDRETTLRVYPVRHQVYPLLNPEFFLIQHLDKQRENRPPDEALRIVVLSKGERNNIDDRLSRMSLSDRVCYEDWSEKWGDYWRHGDFWIPVEFTGPIEASEIVFGKLADPFSEILGVLR